jgi:serine protease Do
MDSLIKTGKVTRGWLGVSIQEVTPNLAKQFGLPDTKGVLVSEVLPDSPAAAAGVKSGDVILNIEGKAVDSPSLLRNLVAQTPVGKSAKVEILRDKKRQTLNIKIAEQPKEVAQAEAEETLKGSEGSGESVLAGIEVRNITPEIARQLGLPANTKGVVVGAVSPASSAAAAGVEPGDVILEVNRQKVSSVAELKQIAGKLPKSEGALLLVLRQGSKLFLAVKP